MQNAHFDRAVFGASAIAPVVTASPRVNFRLAVRGATTIEPVAAVSLWPTENATVFGDSRNEPAPASWPSCPRRSN
jgi:hypothetical protein